jgi:L-fuconolactonase
MEIVDTHCHASPYWFEPIETLLGQMDRNGVAKATLIQMRGQYDNSYLLECAKRFPGRFSVVVLVDTDQDHALNVLEDWAKQGAEGIRLAPGARSPGSYPLAVWRKAEELGLVVSCGGGTTEELASEEFHDLVRQFPDLPIIIEHLGSVGKTAEAPNKTYKQMLGLSQHPNTYIKFHGLGEIAPRPRPMKQPFPFEGFPPLTEMAFESFGAKRMVWGSDFPPVAEREGYHNALHFPMEYIPFRSEEDKEWAFGGTALGLFKFAAI